MPLLLLLIFQVTQVGSETSSLSISKWLDYGAPGVMALTMIILFSILLRRMLDDATKRDERYSADSEKRDQRFVDALKETVTGHQVAVKTVTDAQERVFSSVAAAIDRLGNSIHGKP